jgi:hypothetical protein
MSGLSGGRRLALRGVSSDPTVKKSLMGMERRGWIDRLYLVVNQQWEEPSRKASSHNCDGMIRAG